jgi:hypothetical protein
LWLHVLTKLTLSALIEWFVVESGCSIITSILLPTFRNHSIDGFTEYVTLGIRFRLAKSGIAIGVCSALSKTLKIELDDF